MDEIDLTKGIGAEMLQKYPGGHWATMRGKHVYITEGGEIAPETATNVKAQAQKLTDKPVGEIKAGEMYKYGNKTVTVEKVGRKYLHIKDNQGNSVSVVKSKFAQKAEPTGGKADGKKKEGQVQTQPQQASSTATGGAPNQPNGVSEGAGNQNAEAGAGSKTTGTIVSTPKLWSDKGINVASDFNGDEAYDTYEKWNKQAKGEKVYFQMKMVQYGDMSPEERQQKGITLRKIEHDGEVGAYSAFVDQPKVAGGAVMIDYAEVAPGKRKGLGIGSKVVSQAIKESFDKGYDGRVFLNSHSDSINFYKKIGMDFHGGQYNTFAFEPEKAQKFYEAMTGEKMGKLAKALEEAQEQPEKPNRGEKGLTYEQIIKLEDSMYPRGVLIGDFNERIKSEFKNPYQVEEGGNADE